MHKRVNRLVLVAAFVFVQIGTAIPALAAPIVPPTIFAEAGPGVDLSALVVGQTFGIVVRIDGSTPGEFDAGGSGGGGFAGSFPNLQIVNVVLGDILIPADWSTDPSLFLITLNALAPGSGTFGTQGQVLNSNYGSSSNLSTNLLDYNVVAAPEPATLLLLSAGLAAAGTRTWRRKSRQANTTFAPHN